MKIASFAALGAATLWCTAAMSGCARGTTKDTFALQYDPIENPSSSSSGHSSASSSSSSSGAGGDGSTSSSSTTSTSTSSTSSTSTSSSSSSSSGGCPGTLVDCGHGVCTDLGSDPNNCGLCGRACQPGETCSGGGCVGGGACDTQPDCASCMNCSVGSSCMGQVNACFNNQDCNALITCLQNCMDQACANNCAAQHPAGQSLYIAVEQCAICACPKTCVGMPPPNGSCP